MSYNLGIIRPQLRTQHTVSILVLVLHTLVFGYLGLPGSGLQYYLLAASALNLVILVLYAVPRFRRQKMRRAVTLSLLVNAILWWRMDSWLMAGLLLVMSIMQWMALKSPVVKVNDEGVTYPSFPGKKWAWDQLSRVMVKDAVLSVDLANNELLQSTLDADTSETLDVIAFNRYCAERVKGKW